jgi:predicted RNA-binding protein YlxR (DUF448 family)
VACRTSRDKRDLARIVRTPDGRMIVDATGRQAGRGAYVCVDGDCRAQALHRSLISRALEQPLSDEVRDFLAAGEGASPTIDTTRGGTSGQE